MFDSVNSYYKFHSKIYDLTRWGILFGRNRILDLIPNSLNPQKILDLGCGTGKHLLKLAEFFPEAHITGIDSSEEMLRKASVKIQQSKRIKLFNTDIASLRSEPETYDLILCSYSLSMFGDLNEYIDLIQNSLNQSGVVAIVDFHSTPIPLFERWMKFNHVNISGSLFTQIEKYFKVRHQETKSVYFGLWKYTFFLGQK